jgi:hypothetical protein
VLEGLEVTYLSVFLSEVLQDFVLGLIHDGVLTCTLVYGVVGQEQGDVLRVS